MVDAWSAVSEGIFRKKKSLCASVACVLAGGIFLTADAEDWKIDSVDDLTAALSQAASGDVLLLNPGVYDLAGTEMDEEGHSHLVVDRPIEMRCTDGLSWRTASDGLSGAVLKGGSSMRILRVKTAASFSGISFVDGKTSDDGAGVWIDVSGTSDVVNFTNCVFKACRSENGDGGGICSPYSATAVARDCRFEGNEAQKNGGGAMKGFYYSCVFSNNVAVAAGGGAVSSGEMTDCVCGGNKAKWGGAGSYVTASRCTFTGNSSGIVGGAMSNSHATDCAFDANVSDDKGGALYSDGLYKVRGCTFAQNRARTNGGAICGGHAVSNCSFYGNSAANGGALYGVRTASSLLAVQPVAVMDSSFLTNTVSGSGGAVAECDVASCLFEGNEADKGGAVTQSTLVDCELIGNKANTYGGAAYEVETCRDCTFAGNSVVRYDGGAIYQTKAGAILSGCEIASNKVVGAYRNGGGIFCTAGGSSMLVTNCLIMANSAEGTSSAGGVYGATNVVGCIFRDNTSGFYSGHAWYSAFRDCRFTGKGEVAMSRLYNCELYGYRANKDDYSAPLVANEREEWRKESGFPVFEAVNCLFRDLSCDAIVRVTGDEAYFYNCTFASNVCENSFRLLQGNNAKEPSLNVANCVFGGNRAKDGAAAGVKVSIGFTPVAADVSLSNVLSEGYDLPSSIGASQTSGLLTGAVRFCGDDNFWNEPAYALRPSGRWVDRGVALPWSADAVDLAGRPRVRGKGVDLGCYEFQSMLPGMKISIR